MAEHDLELIYVGDPMCSWCWGFAPVIERLDAAFAIPIRVVAGGLRPGPAAGVLDDELRRVLAHHWDQVESATGQPFDRKALDREGWSYDTMIPDSAVVTMRRLAPAETLRFFARLQHAFYAEAIDVTDAAVYPSLVARFPVDIEEFTGLLASEEIALAAKRDFATAASLGATGFPTLLLRDGETGYVVTRGYAPYEPLAAALTGFIEQRHPTEVSELVCSIEGDAC